MASKPDSHFKKTIRKMDDSDFYDGLFNFSVINFFLVKLKSIIIIKTK